MAQKVHRESLKNAKRIVVKAGSKVLVQSTGRPDKRRLGLLVNELAQLQNGGGETVFVSSGAIGAGLDALGMKTRPKAMPDLQMAAAVGQICLISIYNELFNLNKCQIGQVLLTHDGLKHRERHLNARNTLLNLIANRIIPIINENDAISTEEIKFGDNDVLAALVAILVEADALVLLSTTDGLRDGNKKRVSYIEEVDDDVLGLVSDKQDKLSSGGMASKLQSAQIAAHNGIPVVIANGRKTGALTRIFEGKDEGTLLFPKTGKISSRKRWIAFFNRVEGHLVVDDGAAKALDKGKSLLPVGVKAVEGRFKAGAMVDVQSLRGEHIARGLVEYSSDDIDRFKGQKSAEKSSEVIHRDNMVII
ncbi:glutamate 5-kinase [Pontiella sulfatireligans]|uniref:Glutamate 5-kinase n=1 Tax=Pontiella sulfatireligans TaxID=2750658 RepID=A0A6C2USE3_9BACT|nr:glutamate 5-kinase [Pontiella sulfatireligans]VGO21846.1 Glutamate 5-kinase [Pontiella sulfatireligans]